MTAAAEGGVPVRLLLVEDSENDAMLLLRGLRRGGYEPIHEQVCTPEEMERALEEAAARGEPYEVVISDYYMPRFKAPEALALLRRLGHDVPFIVVSGKIGEDAAVEIMKAGANDYLTKENMARLCPAIGRELKEAGVRRDRERAEEALARSEIRFRRLVEQAADAMFVHDLDGRFVDVNRRACESLGYAKEELLGMAVRDVEVGHDPGSLKRLWDRISSGTPLTLEGMHRRKDGTVFPVEVRVGMFEDGGRPLVLALVRDISGRKEAEKRARETEVRYRTLVEQLPAVTYVQDTSGDKLVSYVSPQTESVLGYAADRELLDPDHWLNIMHPDDRDRVIEEDRRTDRTGEPFKMEYRQFASDGRMVWIRDEATLVRDEEGRSLYWQGIQYDVTEEKLVEEELRRSEERYRTFIDQSTEGIWRFELEVPMPVDLPEDEQLDYFYRHAYLAECNDAMARMYGLGSASELVGARVGDLLPRSEPENVEFLRTAARAGYRLKDGETKESDREGNERVILNNLTGVVADGRLVRVWGTQRDVTERKEAEEQLARLASFPELDPNPIIETSLDGVPTYLNPAAQARLPGLRDLGPRHPALADLEEANRRIWSSGGRPFVREVQVGEGFYQQVISRTPEGGLLRIYATDVTEGRRAQDALRASEERFRSLVQNASDIVLLLAWDGTILYESPAVERMLGFAPEERVGLDVLDLIHPEDRDRVSSVLRDHRDVPGPFPSMEYRVRDKRGSWRHLEAVGENLLHDTAVEGIVVNSRDITERKQTEEALRQSEDLYRNVVEQAAEGIFLLDVDSMRLIEANAALGATLGYATEELKGMSFYDLSAHDRESVDRNAGRALQQGRVSLGVRQYRRKNGGLVDVEISISILPYDGRPVMCVVAHDVTGRLRAERALEEIREAERNRIARELHDSILQDIVYALQEIQVLQIVRQNGDPALGDAADALRRSVEGLRGAIFELRLKETLDDSFVNSLEKLVDLNRRMARGAYEIELVVGDGVPPGLPEGSGRELVRIVQEALTNVRRHSGASHVRVELGVEGDTLYVEVRDDGRGFDSERSRAGMGRHSMRQRAIELGGNIGVQSRPGLGTRVLCRVPLSRLTGGDPP
ncbi:MAG TPA: PAS domain S-box protein [Rubrobacter sp.]|nr:PAS domain S-box protein [Rubrobacter sp.]